MTETLAHGTHVIVLNESFPMDTNMAGYRISKYFEISKLFFIVFEVYLLFFLSMKEQVMNSIRPVGKCNPACYPLRLVRSG